MDTSEFTDKQIEALQALADGYNDQSVSRRDVMKLVGAGGVGALLGGGGAASAVGQASAGTAQSGQLGTPADRVDVFGEDVDATSVNAEEIGIGGVNPWWDEDDNSPHTASSTVSYTATLAGDYDEVLVLFKRDNDGWNAIRFNDRTGSDYEYVDSSDTVTSSATEIPFGTFSKNLQFIHITHTGSNNWINVRIGSTDTNTAQTVRGRLNVNASNPKSIDSITLLDADGVERSAKFRVFGRVLNL